MAAHSFLKRQMIHHEQSPFFDCCQILKCPEVAELGYSCAILVLFHQHPTVQCDNDKHIDGAYVNLYKSQYAKALFICCGGHSIAYIL